MKKHGLTIRFAALQGAVWGIFGLVFSFANPYMTEKLGLTDTMAGIVLCIASAVSCLLQPLFTALADKGRLSPRRILLFSALFMGVCGGCALLPGLSVAGTTLFFGGVCAILQINPSFANALGMAAIRRGEKINFALTRGVGSIGFGVMVRLGSVLIGAMGMDAVAVGAVAMAFLLAFAVLLVPEGRIEGAKKEEHPSSAGEFFRENPKFALLLMGVTILYVGHNVVSNCMFRIAQARLPAGATEAEATAVQGTALMIAAVIELPTMFLFTRVAKKLRCDILLFTSCAFMCLRLVLMYFLPGSIGLCAAQLVQMLGFALFAVSTVYYVGTVISQRNVVKGQTYLGTANTLGGLVACALGGALIDTVGADKMLLVCLSISAVGLILTALSLEKVRQTAGT